MMADAEDDNQSEVGNEKEWLDAALFCQEVQDDDKSV